VTFRTSWVFGAHGGNFAKTMLRLAAERESLNVVADQFGAPTSAALLADVTAQVVGQYKRQGRSGFPFGLYHLVASGATSWHEYAQVVIRAAQVAGKPLKLTAEDVVPIATTAYPLPAPRPINSRLDTNRLRQTFGLELPSWQSGLNHVLQQIL
jgi:dTDP-4-dehydrorhamnose reductase